jgi:predicted DNA binding CopG/RHH family protein
VQRKMQILCSEQQLQAWKVEAAHEGLSLQRFVVAVLDREVARRKAQRRRQRTTD